MDLKVTVRDNLLNVVRSTAKKYLGITCMKNIKPKQSTLNIRSTPFYSPEQFNTCLTILRALHCFILLLDVIMC